MKTSAKIYVGDAIEGLKRLDAQSVQTVVTSPPYWGLRDYSESGQIGLEQSPQDFIEKLCQVFDEVWRVLKDDGTIWVNLGDSYFNLQNNNRNGLNSSLGGEVRGGGEYKTQKRHPGKLNIKPKDLVGIPWRFAFAMQDRGWYLRQDIIWQKPNPMPESVTDRCTKSHEYIFLLTKKPKYYFDNQAIKEEATTEPAIRNRENYDVGFPKGARFSPGTRVYGEDGQRNKRDVWSVNVKPYKEAHFATYPTELIEPCILAGSEQGDTVLDPFSGSGTTGQVAMQHGRNYIGLELNRDYAQISEKRLHDALGMFGTTEIIQPEIAR